ARRSGGERSWSASSTPVPRSRTCHSLQNETSELALAAADDQVHLRAADKLLPRPRPLRDHAALPHGRRLRIPDPAGTAMSGDDSTLGSRQWLALHVRDDAEDFLLRNQAERGGHGLGGVDSDCAGAAAAAGAAPA